VNKSIASESVVIPFITISTCCLHTIPGIAATDRSYHTISTSTNSATTSRHDVFHLCPAQLSFYVGKAHFLCLHFFKFYAFPKLVCAWFIAVQALAANRSAAALRSSVGFSFRELI